jgi:GDP-L-fucose synthase
VGFGADVSIQDLAHMVANVVGYTGQLAFDNTRPEGPARRLLDCTRLKSLDWEPLMDLETGLELTHMDFRLHHMARPLHSLA